MIKASFDFLQQNGLMCQLSPLTFPHFALYHVDTMTELFIYQTLFGSKCFNAAYPRARNVISAATGLSLKI